MHTGVGPSSAKDIWPDDLIISMGRVDIIGQELEGVTGNVTGVDGASTSGAVLQQGDGAGSEVVSDGNAVS